MMAGSMKVKLPEMATLTAGADLFTDGDASLLVGGPRTISKEMQLNIEGTTGVYSKRVGMS